jgi:RNA polymerase sigma-70 factor (ECF subfamily)
MACTHEHLEILQREAERGAARLIRQCRLQPHEFEDRCQDILVELLRKFERYDSARGSVGAFAGVLVKHYVSKEIRRLRRRYQEVSITSLEVAENEQQSELVGTEPSPELSVAMLLALARLRPGQRQLCNQLVIATVAEIARDASLSTATIYRNIQKLRQTLSEASRSQ